MPIGDLRRLPIISSTRSHIGPDYAVIFFADARSLRAYAQAVLNYADERGEEVWPLGIGWSRRGTTPERAVEIDAELQVLKDEVKAERDNVLQEYEEDAS